MNCRHGAQMVEGYLKLFEVYWAYIWSILALRVLAVRTPVIPTDELLPVRAVPAEPGILGSTGSIHSSSESQNITASPEVSAVSSTDPRNTATTLAVSVVQKPEILRVHEARRTYSIFLEHSVLLSQVLGASLKG